MNGNFVVLWVTYFIWPVSVAVRFDAPTLLGGERKYWFMSSSALLCALSTLICHVKGTY